jgi:hypothetical protein
VLAGQFQVLVDSESYALNAGDSVIACDGCRYRITGLGKCFILVHDKEGGQTEILDE